MVIIISIAVIIIFKYIFLPKGTFLEDLYTFFRKVLILDESSIL